MTSDNNGESRQVLIINKKIIIEKSQTRKRFIHYSICETEIKSQR